MSLRASFCAVVLFAACAAESPREPDPVRCANPDDFLLCEAPLLIAHRGGAALRPESTLPAFEHAASLGVDVLETDVRVTADGQVVCIHDADVDRTTDGTGAVNSFTLAELQALDAGYQFTSDGDATHPYRGQGIQIPTLDAVLAAHPDQYFSIEIKPGQAAVADQVLEVVTARGMRDRVIIASFFDEPLARVREVAPEVVTIFSFPEMAILDSLLDEEVETYDAPAWIIQASHDAITAETLARAHRKQLLVQAWTVDDPTEMEALLTLGVDGIITNNPVVAAPVIDAHR